MTRRVVVHGTPGFVAGYLAACFLFFVVSAVLAWAVSFQAYVPRHRAPSFQLYVFVTCAGGLGAAVYCIRSLYTHVSSGDYNPNYLYWYLFSPWIGGVLGMMVHFLVVAGLLAFQTQEPADTVQTNVLFVAVAFLAGFCPHRFVMKLRAVAKVFFAVDGPIESQETNGHGDQSERAGRPSDG